MDFNPLKTYLCSSELYKKLLLSWNGFSMTTQLIQWIGLIENSNLAAVAKEEQSSAN